MNNIRKYTAWLGTGAIMLTLATGCAGPNDTAAENVGSAAVDSTANVADAAGDTTTNVADAAANNLEPTGQAVENSADAAGTNIAQGASAAGDAVVGAGDAMIYTPKIKTALGAEAALNGSDINVDTLSDKKVIALRGTVKTNAQKTMAAAIAKKNAPADYAIQNELKIGAM